MTLVELAELAEGFAWREERIWELSAWVTSHLMNVSGKTVRSTVTPRKLLRKVADVSGLPDAEKDAMWERMKGDFYGDNSKDK